MRSTSASSAPVRAEQRDLWLGGSQDPAERVVGQWHQVLELKERCGCVLLAARCDNGSELTA